MLLPERARSAFGLEAAVAVVTGGGGGLGRAIAETFVDLGASAIVLIDTDRDAAFRVSADLERAGAEVRVVVADVDDEEAIRGAAAVTREAFGRCDVLVNNAGTIVWSPLEDLDAADWDLSMATNLRGHFFCMKHFGRLMLTQGRGSIVNVASVAASIPDAFGGAYSPAKAGAVMLAKVAAVEWGDRGVRVNAVCPGLIDTPMAAPFHQDDSVRERRRRMVAQRRIGEPFELARVVAFLASDASSYVTGQVFDVDGGMAQMMVRLLPKPPIMPDLL